MVGMMFRMMGIVFLQPGSYRGGTANDCLGVYNSLK